MAFYTDTALSGTVNIYYYGVSSTQRTNLKTDLESSAINGYINPIGIKDGIDTRNYANIRFVTGENFVMYMQQGSNNGTYYDTALSGTINITYFNVTSSTERTNLKNALEAGAVNGAVDPQSLLDEIDYRNYDQISFQVFDNEVVFWDYFNDD